MSLRAALAALALLLVAPTTVSASLEQEEDPQKILFLLEYVGTDYADAVRDGEVLSLEEYGESLRFARQILGACERRLASSDPTLALVRTLLQQIETKAPAAEVLQLSRQIAAGLTPQLGAEASPRDWPNIANGGRLWANDCAPCHGSTGAGDGPAAADLQPPPTSLRASLDLSPRRVFQAMTFGIPDTAMPSFVPAYSERQRWDVAFFAMTLRSGFQARWLGGQPTISLAEIAGSSNDDLLAKLRESRPDATLNEVDYLRINFPLPAVAPTAPSGGGEIRDGSAFTAALQLQDAFAAVADRIFPHIVGLSSYEPATKNLAGRGKAADREGWTAATAASPQYAGFRLLHTGSALLLDDDGYLLTSNAALRSSRGELAEFVDLELSDGTHLLGRVVGAEPKLDLAVVQVIAPERLPPRSTELELGDSDRLRTGNWVIGAGSPPGAERVFSVGVVAAAAARQCYQEQLSATLVQSDLSVPSAALGGPVVDIHGRVVGLNVRLASTEPASESRSNSRILPINLAMTLFEALRVAHSDRSPWIGVSVLELQTHRQRLSPALQATLPSSGLFLDNVFDPSPAARAGVRIGDILLKLGGHPIGTVADFQTWMYTMGIGAPCELELLRNGKPLRVQVTIEARPPSATTS